MNETNFNDCCACLTTLLAFLSSVHIYRRNKAQAQARIKTKAAWQQTQSQTLPPAVANEAAAASAIRKASVEEDQVQTVPLATSGSSKISSQDVLVAPLPSSSGVTTEGGSPGAAVGSTTKAAADLQGGEEVVQNVSLASGEAEPEAADMAGGIASLALHKSTKEHSNVAMPSVAQAASQLEANSTMGLPTNYSEGMPRASSAQTLAPISTSTSRLPPVTGQIAQSNEVSMTEDATEASNAAVKTTNTATATHDSRPDNENSLVMDNEVSSLPPPVHSDHGYTPPLSHPAPEPNLLTKGDLPNTLDMASSTPVQMNDSSMQLDDGIIGTEILLSDESEDAAVAQLLARPSAPQTAITSPSKENANYNDTSLQSRLDMDGPVNKDQMQSRQAIPKSEAKGTGNKRPYSEVGTSNPGSMNDGNSFRARIADSNETNRTNPLDRSKSTIEPHNIRTNDKSNAYETAKSRSPITHKGAHVPLEVAKTLSCVFIGSLPSFVTDADVRMFLFPGNARVHIPRPVAIMRIRRPEAAGDGYACALYKDADQALDAIDCLGRDSLRIDRQSVKPVIRSMTLNAKKLSNIPWQDVESWAMRYLEDIIEDRKCRSQPLTSRMEGKMLDSRPLSLTDQLSSTTRASPVPSKENREQGGRHLASRLEDSHRPLESGGRDEHRPRGNYTGRRASPPDHGRARDQRPQERQQQQDKAGTMHQRSRSTGQQAQSDLLRRFDSSPVDRRSPDLGRSRSPPRKYRPPTESTGLLGRLN